MRIEIPMVTEHAIVAVPGEVMRKDWRYVNGSQERREHYRLVLEAPVYLELLIDGAGLEAMARRAILNRSKKCKDGPFVLRVRPTAGLKGRAVQLREEILEVD